MSRNQYPIQLNLFPEELGPTCPDCGRPTKLLVYKENGIDTVEVYECFYCKIEIGLSHSQKIHENMLARGFMEITQL